MALVNRLVNHLFGVVEGLLTLHIVKKHNALGLLEELGHDNVVLVVACSVPDLHLDRPTLLCHKT